LRFLIFLTVPIMLFSNQKFMSDYEYGAMLYENPRGIGCVKCHGKKGKGELIGVYYTTNKKTKQRVKNEVIGSDITKKTLDEMIVSVNRTHDVMPTYSLTKDEVKAIYDYIDKKNR